MTDLNRIEIQLSKAKLGKLFVFSALFLAAGLWMIIKQPETSNGLFNNPVVKALASYGGTLMGLLGIYFFGKKLLDKQPGLIIDEAGIVDNTSVFAFGLIPWSNIAHIEGSSIQATVASKQRFVTLVLHDPEPYIARETNPIKRKLIAMNTKHYGSPVHLTTNGLAIRHEGLMRLLGERLEAYREKEGVASFQLQS